MCKSNFHQRRSQILKARAALAAQMEEIEGDRITALRDGLEPRPLTTGQWETLQQLDAEDGRLFNALCDLQDAQLARPGRSRHAVANKLRVIADRDGLPFDNKAAIQDLIRDIQQWRREVPVIFGGCRGFENA